MSWLLGIAKNALGGLWGYVAAAGAAVVAFMVMRARAKQEGRNEVIVKTKEKEVENVKKARKVGRKVRATPADDNRKRLYDDWSRD